MINLASVWDKSFMHEYLTFSIYNDERYTDVNVDGATGMRYDL